MAHLKKRLVALVPLLVLLMLLFARPAYAQSGTYVFDEGDLLSQEEFNTLEAQGRGYADKYGVGVYLHYTTSMGPNEDEGSGRREYARDFFVSHDLGIGTNKNGIVFVVAYQSRKYVTVKHFNDSSEDPFSDDCVDALEDAAKEELSDDEWYRAGAVYYDTVGEQLAYFSEHGKQWEEPHTMGTIIKVAAALIIPTLIAASTVSSEKRAMLTARMQTEAGTYLDQDSVNLTFSTDTFINRTMSVTPIPKHDDDNDSGGGWSDMGGGFSGSDGGSF